MADKVRSISPEELTSAVKKAVAKNPILKGAKTDRVVTRPPWIMGFIIDVARLEEQSIGQAQAAASAVAMSLPRPEGASPATLIHDGHVILGFLPEPPVTPF